MNRRSAVEKPSRAVAWQEAPAFFPAGDELLFGVLARPVEGSRGTGVIFVPGGWFGTSIGINRLLVNYCRSLAGEGYPSMRFDYHGVGESSGEVDRFALDHPFRVDLQGAVAWMATQGVKEFVLVGICFGGRGVLDCVSDIPKLRGVCLVSVPAHDVGGGRGSKVVRLARSARFSDLWRRAINPWFIRNLFNPNVRRMILRFIKVLLKRATAKFRPSNSTDEGSSRSIESPIVLNGLQELAEQRLPVLMIHGTGDADYESLQQSLSGKVGEVLASDDSRIDVVTIPGSIHGFTRVEAQTSVLETITRWIREL